MCLLQGVVLLSFCVCYRVLCVGFLHFCLCYRVLWCCLFVFFCLFLIHIVTGCCVIVFFCLLQGARAQGAFLWSGSTLLTSLVGAQLVEALRPATTFLVQVLFFPRCDTISKNQPLCDSLTGGVFMLWMLLFMGLDSSQFHSTRAITSQVIAS